MNYHDAEAFLAGGRNKSSRPIANHTRVERIDAETIGIKLHDTYVVKIHSDGSWQLFTGGWYTVTTKDRINRFAPVNVGSDRGRWFLYSHIPTYWTKVGPFFDGICVSQNGTILNPRPQDLEDGVKREQDATWKAISKYAKAYIEAGHEEQIYADALDSSDNAVTCWDCSNPAMAGRTTADNDAKAHLRRHLEGPEFPPVLLLNALRTKGAGPYYFDMVSMGTDYIIDLTRVQGSTLTMLRRWLRDFLKSQLMEVTGAKPFHDYSADRRGGY